MGRFKVKKQSTFIDMTAMSDVTVLLLTFFMLTSNFVRPEPIKVQTPGSVSEIKIPETNLLTIIIEPTGRVFLTATSNHEMLGIIDEMNNNYNLGLSQENKMAFAEQPTVGMPLNQVKSWVSVPKEDREALLKSEANKGIICDSTNNEFKEWIKAARTSGGKEMRIAIKADANTPYATIKNVMNSLQDLDENKYNLITSLKGEDKE